jgi:hypothetical protein
MTSENMNTDQQAALAAANLGGLQKAQNAASWSDHMEDLMQGWGEKAAGLRWIHSKDAGTWKKFADKLSMWGIVLTTVASTAAVATANMDSPPVTYTIGGIGMIATLIQSVKKFYSAEEKAADHGAVAKQFGSFYRYMTLQMGMGREDRKPADALSEWALSEYERLQQEAPNVSGPTISAFRAEFGMDGNIPDCAEDEFIIKIQGRGDTGAHKSVACDAASEVSVEVE